jgi:hypothetical protein
VSAVTTSTRPGVFEPPSTLIENLVAARQLAEIENRRRDLKANEAAIVAARRCLLCGTRPVSLFPCGWRCHACRPGAMS